MFSAISCKYDVARNAPNRFLLKITSFRERKNLKTTQQS